MWDKWSPKQLIKKWRETKKSGLYPNWWCSRFIQKTNGFVFSLPRSNNWWILESHNFTENLMMIGFQNLTLEQNHIQDFPALFSHTHTFNISWRPHSQHFSSFSHPNIQLSKLWVVGAINFFVLNLHNYQRRVFWDQALYTYTRVIFVAHTLFCRFLSYVLNTNVGYTCNENERLSHMTTASRTPKTVYQSDPSWGSLS